MRQLMIVISSWMIFSLVVSASNLNSGNPVLFSSSKKSTDCLKLRGGSSDNVDWRYFLAGSICAATSHGITTPIDVVKTKMQTDPKRFDKKGLIGSAKDIINTEGPAYLLTGLAPTVVGYGLEGALKFGFYETFKTLFGNLTPHKVVNFLLASVVAGAIASIVLCPMEETRIKMVGEKSWEKENLISGMARLIKEGGIFSTFAGLPAMLAKQVPYTMAKQVSFDIFAVILYNLASKFKQTKDMNLKWAISLLSAFLASILACLSSQPGDMILTQSYRSTSGANVFKIINEIYKTHGLGGFFIGTGARIAHVASIITSQLVLYDIVKLLLGLPVTGSH